MVHPTWDEDELRHARLVLLLGRRKWYPHILNILVEGPARLSDLRRGIPGISKKILIENLKQLEADRLVTRTDLSGKTLFVRYELKECRQEAVSKALSLIQTIDTEKE